MNFKTADLCDDHRAAVEVVEPMFRDFGGHTTFGGPISTVRALEDNSLVRQALKEPGQGRVLVADGGGSLRCALLGDRLAKFAAENGWSGVLVYGCVRDADELARIDLGVKALATHPMKTVKRNVGQRDVAVRFAGVRFVPGAFLYADHDGVIVAPTRLD